MAEGSSPLEQDLAQAIATVLARHETSMVTKWVALIESIEEDGARGLWTLTSEDVRAWDTTGMLAHALQLQQAALVHQHEE